MINKRRLPLRALVALMGGTLALSLTVQGAGLQDPAEPQEPEVEDLNPFRNQAEASPQDEMIRLFQEVEGRMNQMGSLLFDASKGETSALSQLGESGIDDILDNADQQPPSGGGGGAALADLLRASSAEGASVLEGIDQILKIAQEQGGGT